MRLGLIGTCVAIYAVSALTASQRSAAAMAEAANKWLTSLGAEQRAKGTFPLDSDERFTWHYVPRETFPRNGLSIKVMSQEQRVLAHELLKTGLSQRGYATATAIMQMETILKAMENSTRIARDPEDYVFSVFGTPSAKGNWGWRVEGHHLSVNFTIAGGSSTASSPSFFGVNPAEVPDGPRKGERLLAAEEDAGRALMMALDPAQREKAMIPGAAPAEIVTANAAKVDPLAPAGIKVSEMNTEAKYRFHTLIQVYTNMMTPDVAAERMSRLTKAGTDNIAFAWAGEVEKGKKHYYRLQGPTFLVEYDNTQNSANHIHTVWRDFNGDFGRDLLREHVNGVPH
jgi:hypothetical protein